MHPSQPPRPPLAPLPQAGQVSRRAEPGTLPPPLPPQSHHHPLPSPCPLPFHTALHVTQVCVAQDQLQGTSREVAHLLRHKTRPELEELELAGQLLEDSLGEVLKWLLKEMLERCEGEEIGTVSPPPAKPAPHAPPPSTRPYPPPSADAHGAPPSPPPLPSLPPCLTRPAARRQACPPGPADAAGCAQHAWPADMQSRRDSHRAPPRRPVSLKIGPQIKSNQTPSTPSACTPLAQALPCPSTGPRLTVVSLTFRVLAQREGEGNNG